MARPGTGRRNTRARPLAGWHASSAGDVGKPSAGLGVPAITLSATGREPTRWCQPIR